MCMCMRLHVHLQTRRRVGCLSRSACQHAGIAAHCLCRMRWCISRPCHLLMRGCASRVPHRPHTSPRCPCCTAAPEIGVVRLHLTACTQPLTSRQSYPATDHCARPSPPLPPNAQCLCCMAAPRSTCMRRSCARSRTNFLRGLATPSLRCGQASMACFFLARTRHLVHLEPQANHSPGYT